MPEVINVKTSELIVSHNDYTLRTGSVGSCVVIALYDSDNKIGGMAHSMLPTRKKGDIKELISFESGNTSAKYVDEAVENLIVGIKKNGGNTTSLVAKLVGGASMFRKLSNITKSIGRINVQTAKDKLAEYGIKVESEDTGGSAGKVVNMNLTNGLVEVITTL